MAFGFHGDGRFKSALARLVARVGLVDHVDLAAATHDLAVRVTLLRGFDGGDDFHKRRQNRVRTHPCQRGKKKGSGLNRPKLVFWPSNCLRGDVLGFGA